MWDASVEPCCRLDCALNLADGAGLHFESARCLSSTGQPAWGSSVERAQLGGGGFMRIPLAFGSCSRHYIRVARRLATV